MEEGHYPYEDEISAFFEGSFLSFKKSVSMFKSKGILYFTSKKSEIGRFASHQFYGYDDIENMREIVGIKKDTDRISGFEIKTIEAPSNIAGYFSINSEVDTKLKLKVQDVVPQENESCLVKYYYERKAFGKMNLMYAQDIEGKFTLQKLKNCSDTILVKFNYAHNADYIAIEQLLRSIMKENQTMKIVPITLQAFDVKTRIGFIDSILKYDYKDWTIETVIELRVRKPLEVDEDEEDSDAIRQISSGEGEPDEYQEDEPAGDEMLAGINDALLQGQNLRTNSFVKKCEESGYYFPSIDLRLRHRTLAHMVDLSIEFKFRPKMPEIEIVEGYSYQAEQMQTVGLPEEFKKELLDSFFNDFIDIYNKHMSDIAPKLGEAQPATTLEQ